MEQPERKRMKSSAQTAGSSLLPGWTEHTAPTGHKYYYHKQSKKSTYTKPEPEPAVAIATEPFAGLPDITAGVDTAYPTWTVDYSGHSNGYVPPQTYQQRLVAGSYAPRTPSAPVQYAHEQQQNHISPARRPSQQPQDRPKRKEHITNCKPWILVYTRLGRRFVHNTTTGQSLWKFPTDVMTAVITHDAQRAGHGAPDPRGHGSGANRVPVRDKRARIEESAPGADQEADDEAAMAAELEAQQLAAMEGESVGHVVPYTAPKDAEQQGSESEYEEVEVTDDEDDGSLPDEENHDHEAADQAQDELNEDDFAYQLQAMNEQQDIDLEGGEVSDTQTPDDAQITFHQMLDDWSISPFTLWTSILDSPPLSEDRSYDLLSDERFSVLPSSKLRKEAFDIWSRTRIAEKRAAEQAAQQQQVATTTNDADPDPDSRTLARTTTMTTMTTPRSRYLAFLHEKTTTGLDAVAANGGKKKRTQQQPLYWAEFKRKFKKEDAMKDARVNKNSSSNSSGSGGSSSSSAFFEEKDREELYRAHCSRISKLGFAQREADFLALLKEASVAGRNLSLQRPLLSLPAGLPCKVTEDLRFISLSLEDRNKVLETYCKVEGAA